MTTTNQLAANRLNAQKSTGPRTEDGKARSSQNSITHGAFARLPQLPGEDPDIYQAIADRAYAAFPPTNLTVALLVDQLIADLRTLHRLKRVEHGLTTRFLAMTYSDEADYYREAAEDDPENRDILLEKAAECDRLQEACSHAEESLLARAFARDADNTDPLPKLHRYLTTTHRRIDKTIRELRNLQNEPISRDETNPSILASDSCLLTPDLQNEPNSPYQTTHLSPSTNENSPFPAGEVEDPDVSGGTGGVGPRDESGDNFIKHPSHVDTLQNEPISGDETDPSMLTPDSCLPSPERTKEPYKFIIHAYVTAREMYMELNKSL